MNDEGQHIKLSLGQAKFGRQNTLTISISVIEREQPRTFWNSSKGERKSVSETLRQLPEDDAPSSYDNWSEWIENLFLMGLIGLRHVDLKG